MRSRPLRPRPGELGSETVAARRPASSARWPGRGGWTGSGCGRSRTAGTSRGALERFLIARGERIVRVPPKLTAGARNGARERGKTDPIDAVAVARAALREGIDTLPAAFLDGRALEIRLLLDHHDDLVARALARSDAAALAPARSRMPESTSRPRALDRAVWLDRLGRWLAVRPAERPRPRSRARLLAAIRAHTREIRELERELAALVAALRTRAAAVHGCGPLTAAKLIGETAGAQRFPTDAKLARAAGVAPIPASSGRTERHRLDRGGNRQLNCALHRIAVNNGRRDPDTAAYLARKQAEGKTRREALRCLKRHLARRVWTLLTHPPNTPTTTAPALT